MAFYKIAQLNNAVMMPFSLKFNTNAQFDDQLDWNFKKLYRA
jgi:hypothetical protein